MVNQGQSGFKYPSQYGMILSWLLQFVEEELLFPLTHHAPLITDISSHIPLALRVIKKVCLPCMDFRKTHCAWCKLRAGPLEDCTSCPKFRRYKLKSEPHLAMEFFAKPASTKTTPSSRYSAVRTVFSRRMAEDFECYSFCIEDPYTSMRIDIWYLFSTTTQDNI